MSYCNQSSSNTSDTGSRSDCAVCDHKLDCKDKQLDHEQLMSGLLMCEHVRRLMAGPSNIDHIRICNVFCQRSPRLMAGPVRQHQLDDAKHLQEHIVLQAHMMATQHLEHASEGRVMDVELSPCTGTHTTNMTGNQPISYDQLANHDISVDALNISF